jgi:hypothetical protein
MMMGNPKDSEWYSIGNERRKRKAVMITLSPEALVKADALANRYKDNRSQLLERLILEEAKRRGL